MFFFSPFSFFIFPSPLRRVMCAADPDGPKWAAPGSDVVDGRLGEWVKRVRWEANVSTSDGPKWTARSGNKLW